MRACTLMDPILTLVPVGFTLALVATLIVLGKQANKRSPGWSEHIGSLKVDFTPVVEAGDPHGEITVYLPTPLHLPLEVKLEHHPGIEAMGWQRADLYHLGGSRTQLHFDGSDRWRLAGDIDWRPRSHDSGPEKVDGPVPRYRIVVHLEATRLRMAFVQVTSHERLQAIGQAVAQLALALLDEQQRPLRELAEAQGWRFLGDHVRGEHGPEGEIAVELRQLPTLWRLKLEFPSTLPAGFEAAHTEHLRAPDRFDNPVLDMLLAVKKPPEDERSQDERSAELLLALLHGHPGARLAKHRLELDLPRSEAPGPVLDQALELVGRVR